MSAMGMREGGIRVWAWKVSMYLFGLLAHAIRYALLEALKVLCNVSLLLQKHCGRWNCRQEWCSLQNSKWCQLLKGYEIVWQEGASL